VLVLAWAALLLAGWAVGSLVTSDHPAFDAAVVTDLRGAPHSGLTGAIRAITWLGSPLTLDVVFAAALVALLVRRSWRHALFLTLASPGTVLMVQLIRPAVDRARPLGPHLTPADGSSWPSGHASNSAALYGALLLIALSTPVLSGRRARRTLGVLVAALLALIGLSRVYLGVHYPTDVLAAWLLVTGWLIALDRTVGHAGPARLDARERA
jgi:undecaprenyl-diphosphatase